MPLKLILRTADYSYPIVQGQQLTMEQKNRTPGNLHDERILSEVHVLCNEADDGSNVTGCCRHTKANRVVLLREFHFSAASELWDVYETSTNFWSMPAPTPGYKCLNIALVPSKMSTATKFKEFKAWKYAGVCRGNVLTMDLEAVLNKHLRSVNGRSTKFVTTPTFHCHVEIYIDSIVDETQQWAPMELWDACEPPPNGDGKASLCGPLFIDHGRNLPAMRRSLHNGGMNDTTGFISTNSPRVPHVRSLSMDMFPDSLDDETRQRLSKALWDDNNVSRATTGLVHGQSRVRHGAISMPTNAFHARTAATFKPIDASSKRHNATAANGRRQATDLGKQSVGGPPKNGTNAETTGAVTTLVHTLMKESTIHNKQSSKRTASSSSAQPQQRTANANAAAIGPPTYASITKSDNRPAAAASTAPDRIESPSENRFSGHATWNEVPDGSNWS